MDHRIVFGSTIDHKLPKDFEWWSMLLQAALVNSLSHQNGLR